MPKQVLIGTALAFTLCVGVIAGRVWSVESSSLPSSVLREDVRAPIPVVKIDGCKGSALTGSVRGNTRLAFGGEVVSGSGEFRIASSGVCPTLSHSAIPDGTRFVASRRGKKYYPAGSTSAQKLSPQNLLYFSSSSDAEAAGYVAGQ